MFDFFVFFFFKQKTAYEMRISDWSSDVCSSDLSCASSGLRPERSTAALIAYAPSWLAVKPDSEPSSPPMGVRAMPVMTTGSDDMGELLVRRSEERRVGKECVSTCRSRWSP